MISRVYYAGRSPAKRWTIRAQQTPLILRRAMGKNITLVKNERAKLIDSTIYQRGLKPKGRFTYKLKNSERIFIAGNVFGIANNAKSKKGYKYAQKRNDMTGYSKRYKMYKNSKFANKALTNTSTLRGRNIRLAMQQIKAAGG